MIPSNAAKTQRLKLRSEDQETVEQLLQSVGERQAGFVLTELDTAITFCNVALSTSDPKRRLRNIKNAVIGYETALRFSDVPQVDLKGNRDFQEKIAYLRDLLHELRHKV
jgi:hypothetical protein